MNAIEIKNISKSYKDFALQNISFNLPEGGILGFVGENGAGKSTTIKIIMNALDADSGSINVLGVENTSKDFTAVKENIGVVLDEAYFPEVISAKNVNAIMKNSYKNWEEEKYFSLIEKFGLPLDKQFKEFSRGMRMKLAIAAALSHKTKLLVLDEATSGLDPMVREEILDIFKDFASENGHSILISSHIVSDLEKICDSIAFIHSGKLLFCKEKADLLKEYGLLYLSGSEFDSLPKDAVIGQKMVDGKIEVLVKRELLGDSFSYSHLNLEDIILFLAKGGNRE